MLMNYHEFTCHLLAAFLPHGDLWLKDLESLPWQPWFRMTHGIPWLKHLKQPPTSRPKYLQLSPALCTSPTSLGPLICSDHNGTKPNKPQKGHIYSIFCIDIWYSNIKIIFENRGFKVPVCELRTRVEISCAQNSGTSLATSWPLPGSPGGRMGTDVRDRRDYQVDLVRMLLQGAAGAVSSMRGKMHCPRFILAFHGTEYEWIWCINANYSTLRHGKMIEKDCTQDATWCIRGGHESSLSIWLLQLK